MSLENARLDRMYDYEISHHEKVKQHTAKRRANENLKKAMHMKRTKYRCYHYFIKDHRYDHTYETVFVPAAQRPITEFTIDAKTGRFSQRVIGYEEIPEHWARKRISIRTVHIKPYLQYYSNSRLHRTYKRVATKKTRMKNNHSEELSSNPSIYRKEYDLSWYY